MIYICKIYINIYIYIIYLYIYYSKLGIRHRCHSKVRSTPQFSCDLSFFRKIKETFRKSLMAVGQPNFLFIQSPFTFTFIYIVDTSTV